LKIGLYLSSVRTEDSHVRTIFCDILQKQRNSIFISFTSERFDRVSGRSSLKSFSRSNGTLEYSEILDIVRTCYHVVRKSCRNFPNSVNCWNPTPCWTLIDLASGRCCSDVRTSSMFICKTLRGVRMPSKARLDGCTGTGCSDLKIAWNLHGHLLRNLWPYRWHEMRDCPYYLKTLNRIENPVKKQPLHKVFFVNQNVANIKY